MLPPLGGFLVVGGIEKVAIVEYCTIVFLRVGKERGDESGESRWGSRRFGGGT